MSVINNEKSKTGKNAESTQTETIEMARKEGYFLGIPKIVIVNPSYLRMTYTDFNTSVDLISSQKKVAHFEKLILNNAKIAGLDLSILNTFEFTKEDVQKFNDYALLKEWFQEQSDAESVSIRGFRQKEIEELAKSYNTEYFLWTGVLGLQIPVAGSFLGVKEKGMYLYSILYNVKTGKNYIIKSEAFDKKDSDMILNAHIYDTFCQIKTKKEGSKNNSFKSDSKKTGSSKKQPTKRRGS